MGRRCTKTQLPLAAPLIFVHTSGIQAGKERGEDSCEKSENLCK
jgi:hypothetical protein